MKKIKKLIIMGLIVAFAAFLVFPTALFAATVVEDSSSITKVVPGECGEATEVCVEWEFGYGPLNVFIGLKNAGETNMLPGFPIGGSVDALEGSKCFDLGVLPPGDYDVYLRIMVGDSSSAHINGRDHMRFTVEECPKGTIGVEKVDSGGNILTGAGFTLYNADKSVIVVAEKMVDAAGKVAFGNLPLGTYVVSETTVPGGHTGMADKTVVVNAGNAGSVINVVATNTKKTPPPEEVEVQGLTEEGSVEVLALTGQNPLFYILGILLFAIAGGLVFGLRAVRTKK